MRRLIFARPVDSSDNIKMLHPIGAGLSAIRPVRNAVLELIAEPKTADDHYFRASAYYLDHHFEDANRESDAALTLAPDNPRISGFAHATSATCWTTGRSHRSRLKKPLLWPRWDEPYYFAGVSLYFVGRFPEADKNLSRAVELNPKSAVPFLCRL